MFRWDGWASKVSSESHVKLVTCALEAFVLSAPSCEQAPRLRPQGGDQAGPSTKLRHSVAHNPDR